MSLTLTPVYSNTGTGANQVPFDPTNWTQFDYLNTYPGDDTLQILNGFIETTGLVDADGAVYNTSINWATANNQYIQATLTRLHDTGGFPLLNLYLRSQIDGQGLYRLLITGNSGDKPGTFTYYSDFITSDNAQGTQFTLAASQGAAGDGLGDVYFNYTPGDVFTFAVIGPYPTGTLYALHNGALLFSASLGLNDGTNPIGGANSGNPGIQIDVNGSNQGGPYNTTDTEVNNLIVGTASGFFSGAYSQPDCRHYATFPNTSINVNGTLMYTGQVSDNAAIPPTDSRKVGAPVASNISYPQNSRTPGTYGPNE